MNYDKTPEFETINECYVRLVHYLREQEEVESNEKTDTEETNSCKPERG